MTDLYLQVKMKPELSLNTISEWDALINAEIDNLLAKDQESAPGPDPFNTPAMKKAMLKAQIKETLKLKELSQYIQSALNILVNDGKKCLDKDQFNALMETFSHAHEYLAKPAKNLENYQTILHISDAQMEAIAKIAIADFNQNQFADCLAVFILLTTLRPDIAGYWNRAGIAAQKAGIFDLAINFYNASLELDSELMSSHLFLIDCYLSLKMFHEAQNQYAIAKSLSETQEMDEASAVLFSKLKNQVKANIAGD